MNSSSELELETIFIQDELSVLLSSIKEINLTLTPSYLEKNLISTDLNSEELL